MNRILPFAVVAMSTFAYAEEAPAPALLTDGSQTRALWVESSLDNLGGSVALGYERWFTPSLSVLLDLGGSMSQNTPTLVLTGSGEFTGNTNSYALSAELQLRKHWASGAFVAESLSVVWQRLATVIIGGPGSTDADNVTAAEAVFAGWGHTFPSGIRVEIFAGPRFKLQLSGVGGTALSVGARSLGLRVGFGVGYAF